MDDIEKLVGNLLMELMIDPSMDISQSKTWEGLFKDFNEATYTYSVVALVLNSVFMATVCSMLAQTFRTARHSTRSYSR